MAREAAEAEQLAPAVTKTRQHIACNGSSPYQLPRRPPPCDVRLHSCRPHRYHHHRHHPPPPPPRPHVGPAACTTVPCSVAGAPTPLRRGPAHISGLPEPAAAQGSQGLLCVLAAAACLRCLRPQPRPPQHTAASQPGSKAPPPAACAVRGSPCRWRSCAPHPTKIAVRY
jgi:hypothetical protein